VNSDLISSSVKDINEQNLHEVVFSVIGVLSVLERLMDHFFLTQPTCEDLEALQRSLCGARLLISSLAPKVTLTN
jgi:hypothetical protein